MTEKDYNPERRNKKVLANAKQKTNELPKEPIKKEEKVEEKKIEEKKVENSDEKKEEVKDSFSDEFGKGEAKTDWSNNITDSLEQNTDGDGKWDKSESTTFSSFNNEEEEESNDPRDREEKGMFWP